MADIFGIIKAIKGRKKVIDSTLEESSSQMSPPIKKNPVASPVPKLVSPPPVKMSTEALLKLAAESEKLYKESQKKYGR
jgi:hypothetical protein